MITQTLRRFRGGLALDGHRSESGCQPPRPAALPAELVFPLRRRDGRLAPPWVTVGEAVRRGQVLAGGDEPYAPPLHASTSGRVVAIEPRPAPHPAGLESLAIVVAADGLDTPLETGTPPDWREQPPTEWQRRIQAAGVVGLGGAGFPTAAKLAPGIHTLILNGVECEPYITCDESLLRHDAATVLAGAEILRGILGAERCLLAIENDRPAALDAAERARESGGGYGHTRIVAVPARYPAGGERQLIRTLTGREVPAGGLPADLGIVCLNVGTAAAAFRAVALGEPLISRIVTVTGRGVRRPCNLLARLGTPIRDLVAQCGGYTDAAERLILGGPMMGFALATDAVPVTPAANCILVAAADELDPPSPPQPCIRCGDCAEVCPAGLLPQQLYGFGRSRQLDRSLDHGLLACIECGCCDLACPSHIPLTQAFRETKALARTQQRDRERAAHARARFEARQTRKEAEKSEHAEAARRRRESLTQSPAPEIRQAIERARQKRAGLTAADSSPTPEQDR